MLAVKLYRVGVFIVGYNFYHDMVELALRIEEKLLHLFSVPPVLILKGSELISCNISNVSSWTKIKYSQVIQIKVTVT